MWGGLGNDIDSAFQWKDHKTYFFKGKGFWKFNDHLMVVAHDRPRSSAQFWMKCPKSDGEENVDEGNGPRRQKFIEASSAKGPLSSNPWTSVILGIIGAFRLNALVNTHT